MIMTKELHKSGNVCADC